MSVALPSKLLYQTKIESAAARSFRSNIQPQNGTGTYNAGDTIIVNIPTRNNLVLVPSEQSYLKFTATIKNGAATSNFIRWDSGGAHGFIQRMRFFWTLIYYLILIIIMFLLRCFMILKFLPILLMVNIQFLLVHVLI